MATTISAMDLAAATRKARLSQPEAVDHDAVAAFMADALGQPREKLIPVIQRMHTMIQRGERARGPKGFVGLETMAAVADALTAQIAGEQDR